MPSRLLSSFTHLLGILNLEFNRVLMLYLIISFALKASSNAQLTVPTTYVHISSSFQKSRLLGFHCYLLTNFKRCLYLPTYLPTTLTLSFSCRSLTGVFTADNTRKRLANIPGSNKEGLEKFVVKKYYKVDLANNPTLGAVSRMLDIAPYVVVVKTGKMVSYATTLQVL